MVITARVVHTTFNHVMKIEDFPKLYPKQNPRQAPVVTTPDTAPVPTDLQNCPESQLLNPPSLNPTLAVYPAPPMTAPPKRSIYEYSHTWE